MTGRKLRITLSTPAAEVLAFLETQIDRLDLDPIEADAVRRVLDEGRGRLQGTTRRTFIPLASYYNRDDEEERSDVSDWGTE